MQNIIDKKKLYALREEASHDVLVILLKIYFKDLRNNIYALETLSIMGLVDEALIISDKIQKSSHKVGAREIELLSKTLKEHIKTHNFEKASEVLKKMKEARTLSMLEIKKLS